MSTKRFSVLTFSVVALLIVIVAGVGLYSVFGTDQTQTCTVTEKDRTRDSEGNSDMRVYTEECGVLQVQDTPLRGVWVSADIFASLEEEQSYEVTTYGWRVPFLSMFPTVIEVN